MNVVIITRKSHNFLSTHVISLGTNATSHKVCFIDWIAWNTHSSIMNQIISRSMSVSCYSYLVCMFYNLFHISWGALSIVVKQAIFRRAVWVIWITGGPFTIIAIRSVINFKTASRINVEILRGSSPQGISTSWFDNEGCISELSVLLSWSLSFQCEFFEAPSGSIVDFEIAIIEHYIVMG